MSETQSSEANGPSAVVRTSGKQFLVSEGSQIEVNRIEGDVGQSVVLDDILLVNNGADVQVGTPVVEGATVEASIVSHKRGPKLIVYKKIRRHGKEWKKGHRQDLTCLQINKISA